MSPMVSGPKLAIWLTAWMALAPGITTAEEPAPHTEATVVPGAAYDSDLGFGFGVVSDVARHHPDFDPFKARMAAQLFLYLGPRPPRAGISWASTSPPAGCGSRTSTTT